MADDTRHFGIHLNSVEERNILEPFLEVIGDDSASARAKDALKLYTQIIEMIDELEKEFENDAERRLWINMALIEYEKKAREEPLQ